MLLKDRKTFYDYFISRMEIQRIKLMLNSYILAETAYNY